jgi:hypothetical protein
MAGIQQVAVVVVDMVQLPVVEQRLAFRMHLLLHFDRKIAAAAVVEQVEVLHRW